MIEPTAAALPLVADWGWLSSRILGGATLISIAAFVLGYVVSLIWPKQHNPQVFGCLAALALVGVLISDWRSRSSRRAG